MYERLEISEFIFEMIGPQMIDYFELDEFKKKDNYKKTTTMIKKYYHSKLKNIKLDKYNHYVVDINKRYEKVYEMEYLDDFFNNNESIVRFIYCLDISEDEARYLDIATPFVSEDYENQRDKLSKVYKLDNVISDYDKIV